MSLPSFYTIPATIPFADALAEGVMTQYGGDPLQLSQLMILLPTRRACRTVQEAFLRQTGGKPLLLPRLQPIGDADEEDLMLRAHALDEAAVQLPPSFSQTHRQLILSKLVWQWQKTKRFDQASRLAIDLARFLDELHREEIEPRTLEQVAPEEFSQHWQEILQFLHIILQAWPNILEERRRMDPVARRNRLIDLQTEWLKRNPPEYPIIAAGSTGSVPATARLLTAIARLPEGCVILPGLDTHLEDEAWEELPESHPQYGLQHLLHSAGVPRKDVQLWPCRIEPPASEARNRLLSELMRPAHTTERWQSLNYSPSGGATELATAFQSLHTLTCTTLQEEAEVIGLRMREVLETPKKTAMLVTHDRRLARRVAGILQRWQVEINDSAGTPLLQTPRGAFLMLIAEMAASRAAPVPLLALLKHPLATHGESPAAFRDKVRILEKTALRGIRLTSGIDGLIEEMKRHEATPPLTAWLKALGKTFESFLQIFTTTKEVPIRTLLRKQLALAEALAADNVRHGAQRLWGQEDGEKLADVIADLLESPDLDHPIDPVAWPGVLETLLQGHVVRPKYGLHPRLTILSPMEARLQQADIVILGGLNEGSWPPEASADPWLSRPMRAQLGLPAPERAIGLAAHDFATLACAGEVMLTRSGKVDGTPTVPSRWLLKLEALRQIAGQPEIHTSPWRHWAREMNRPAKSVTLSCPAPVPPAGVRPHELSATQIERLLRDPYAVYAAKVLRLKPLREIDEEPGAAEYGSLIHKALELFAGRYPHLKPEDYHRELLECGQEAFTPMQDRPAVQSFWWPRFERIAEAFARLEAVRAPAIDTIHAEQTGKMIFEIPLSSSPCHSRAGGNLAIPMQSAKDETPGKPHPRFPTRPSGPLGNDEEKDVKPQQVFSFTLTAKADRIDADTQGKLSIIDYKTGSSPSEKDVTTGFSPQLPLEALIVNMGGFEGISGEVEKLVYSELKGGDEPVKEKEIKTDMAEIVEQTRAGLLRLLTYFAHPDSHYLPCPWPAKAPAYNDYEHLERLQEWGG